ncbi:MAG: fumarate hydratase [Candidatus Bathyarchaeota archaeon]|nr:MAG: fumarate hydratase [Candidatus Bathyarchaeota archaeon]
MNLERTVRKTAIGLLKLAATQLPEDIVKALEEAYRIEDSDVAKTQLDNILQNIGIAEETKLPMCQDTGLVIFFNEVGRGFPRDLNIYLLLKEATREATKIIPLRPNAVHPLTRDNSGDNTGTGVPIVNWNLTETDYLDITVMLKGAGSENMSNLHVLNPSEGVEGIRDLLLETVTSSGGKPCPPIILGIGIGGTADEAMKLAKKATLRPLNKKHADQVFRDLEKRLLEDVNKTGIGPMGLGGKTTALGVKVEYSYCHTASLPVGINVQCWAARRSAARIYKDGTVEILSHRGESFD